MTETLSAQARERSGTGGARAVRRDGQLPGIIYGDGKDPQPIKLDPIDMLKAYRRPGFMSSIIDLEIDGKAEKALPRDVQTHPVKDHIMHVDFLRVGPKTRVTVDVPVHFTNEEQSQGLGRGGVLNIVRHDVELSCPAMDIPEFIEGDLAGLDIGDSVKISAIALPDGVKPTITDRDFTIATIAAPTIMAAETEESEEEGEAAPAEAEGDQAEDSSEESDD